MDTVRDNSISGARANCAVSWSAVIAGALVAFSLSVLFNMLNAGLGLVAFPESFRALGTLGMGGYFWLIICGIIAMFIAGWVAGKVYSFFSASSCGGVLHGFLAWSLALLISLIVAAHFAQASAQAAAAAKLDNRVDSTRSMEQPATTATTEDAADMLGSASLGIFFIFLLGAAAASVGGYVGARHEGLGNHPSHPQTPNRL